MSSPQPPALLHDAGLPDAWAGLPAWRMLDTHFDAARLLHAWRCWRDDPRRPTLLHYVACTAQPPTGAQVLAGAAPWPALTPLAEELATQCWGLLPGFHRLLLAQGRLALTLCVGELPALLRAQRFQADSVLLDMPAGAAPWDRWNAKALARCCRRGTRLAQRGLDAAARAQLTQAGFALEERQGVFQPHWEPRRPGPPGSAAATPADCLVIGAGLAGASVAEALARRGWQVRVLDAAPAPAAGASGLPAGLMVAHVSADDSPRSRLSRAGVRLTLQQAALRLEAGTDWQRSGVLEHRLDRTAALPPAWPATGLAFSAPADAALRRAPWARGMAADAPSLWHAQAGWIRPARLVQAWLAQPGIVFQGDCRVARLRPTDTGWQALDAQDRPCAQASHLVLANAGEAPRLLGALRTDPSPIAAGTLLPPPRLQALHGVLSWGLVPPTAGTAWPPVPVNGLGSLIPGVPLDDGTAWYAGATYDTGEAPLPEAEAHRANLDRLQRLLPAAGALLQAELAAGRVRGWRATRYAWRDRLPLVGPLQTGPAPRLWISTALGSRGLSLAMLCAELLAARLGGEPLPLEAALADKLDVGRIDDSIDE